MQNNPEYASTVREFTPWFSNKYGRNKHTFLLPGDSASLMGRLMMEEANSKNLPLPRMKFLDHAETGKLYFAQPSALEVIAPYVFGFWKKQLMLLEDFAFEGDKINDFSRDFMNNFGIRANFVLMLATDYIRPTRNLDVYKVDTKLGRELFQHYDRRKMKIGGKR